MTNEDDRNPRLNMTKTEEPYMCEQDRIWQRQTFTCWTWPKTIEYDRKKKIFFRSSSTHSRASLSRIRSCSQILVKLIRSSSFGHVNIPHIKNKNNANVIIEIVTQFGKQRKLNLCANSSFQTKGCSCTVHKSGMSHDLNSQTGMHIIFV